MACFDGLINWERDLEAIEKKYCQTETDDPLQLAEMSIDEMCEFYEKEEQNGVVLHQSDDTDTEEDEVVEEKSFDDGIYLQKLKDFRKNYEERTEEENKKNPIDFLCLENDSVCQSFTKIRGKSEIDLDDSRCYPSDFCYSTPSIKEKSRARRVDKGESRITLDRSIKSETDLDDSHCYRSDICNSASSKKRKRKKERLTYKNYYRPSIKKEKPEEQESRKSFCVIYSTNEANEQDKPDNFSDQYYLTLDRSVKLKTEKYDSSDICNSTPRVRAKKRVRRIANESESRIILDRSIKSETKLDDTRCYPSDICNSTSSEREKSRAGRIENRSKSRITLDRSMKSETDLDDSQCYPQDVCNSTPSIRNKSRSEISEPRIILDRSIKSETDLDDSQCYPQDVCNSTSSKKRKRKIRRLYYKSRYRPSIKKENSGEQESRKSFRVIYSTDEANERDKAFHFSDQEYLRGNKRGENYKKNKLKYSSDVILNSTAGEIVLDREKREVLRPSVKRTNTLHDNTTGKVVVGLKGARRTNIITSCEVKDKDDDKLFDNADYGSFSSKRIKIRRREKELGEREKSVKSEADDDHNYTSTYQTFSSSDANISQIALEKRKRKKKRSTVEFRIKRRKLSNQKHQRVGDVSYSKQENYSDFSEVSKYNRSLNDLDIVPLHLRVKKVGVLVKPEENSPENYDVFDTSKSINSSYEEPINDHNNSSNDLSIESSRVQKHSRRSGSKIADLEIEKRRCKTRTKLTDIPQRFPKSRDDNVDDLNSHVSRYLLRTLNSRDCAENEVITKCSVPCNRMSQTFLETRPQSNRQYQLKSFDRRGCEPIEMVSKRNLSSIGRKKTQYVIRSLDDEVKASDRISTSPSTLGRTKKKDQKLTYFDEARFQAEERMRQIQLSNMRMIHRQYPLSKIKREVSRCGDDNWDDQFYSSTPYKEQRNAIQVKRSQLIDQKRYEPAQKKLKQRYDDTDDYDYEYSSSDYDDYDDCNS